MDASDLVVFSMNRKKLLSLLLLALGLTMGCAQAKDVYLVSGQSNSWRLSQIRGGDQKLPHTLYYFGMGCTKEPTVAKMVKLDSISEKSMGYGLVMALMEHAQDDIVLVQYSRCGAGVFNAAKDGWFPGDDPKNGKSFEGGLCASFEKYYRSAEAIGMAEFDRKWNLKGMFWHQGEGDSRKPDAVESYPTNIRNVFYRIRKVIGEETPIVMGEVRDLHKNCAKVNQHMHALAEEDSTVTVVPVQDLTFEDKGERKNVHFDLKGCIALGKRMVEAHLKMIK